MYAEFIILCPELLFSCGNVLICRTKFICGLFPLGIVKKGLQKTLTALVTERHNVLDNVASASVRGKQHPLGIIDRLVQVGDRAPAQFCRADKLVADFTDNLFPRGPNYPLCRRIEINDLMGSFVDDDDPSLD